ncbi:fructose-1,6-bisphosphatase/inositol monophosphatase family enzyme [Hoeflea marina]|uniref:Fructose-1,6-bisphosphatase/inositol monophosphatase family enzyme n=1 Tax=Hoeflea marina TaxID=274592 RepID=A0A317PUN0_9HYPH|nr:inositol monophosphatase family protein [Hoeflea marina]PWW04394.1 fructose-1,6-bisphosphatase/inositol monophosphatase family enzyme [Hoeflea marina]
MSFASSDMDWLANLLAETAAAEIMPRFRRLDSGDIRQKTSAADLVTEADVNAERVITAALKARYPGATVLGEEAVSDNATLLDGWVGEGLAFVIDPVDGTFNFASGVPVFGVMLAVVQNGETIGGIIHDPVGKDFIMAEKGGGARWRPSAGAERAMSVATPREVSQMIGAVSWSYMDEPERAMLARNQTACMGQVAYRAAAQEYRLLAEGAIHFIVYNKLMPWDHLPGTLIVEEAGGYVRRFDGSVYRPDHVDGGLLAASDPDSWHALREVLWRPL